MQNIEKTEYLKQLILSTDVLEVNEKQDWLQLLPRMNDMQMRNLKDLLAQSEIGIKKMTEEAAKLSSKLNNIQQEESNLVSARINDSDNTNIIQKKDNTANLANSSVNLNSKKISPQILNTDTDEVDEIVKIETLEDISRLTIKIARNMGIGQVLLLISQIAQLEGGRKTLSAFESSQLFNSYIHTGKKMMDANYTTNTTLLTKDEFEEVVDACIMLTTI